MRFTHASRFFFLVFFMCTVGFVACGGSEFKSKSTGTTPSDEDSLVPSDLVVEQPASAVEISGLLGTIPQHKVESAIKKRWERFEECYGEALEVLEEIEGSIELAMEVNSEGEVVVAYLRDGDLGSEEAQNCFVEQMKRINFPKPAGGGKAVISFPMDLPAPYEHPKPYNWSGVKASEVLSENTADLERCLKGETGVQLTLYVGAGGNVVSAGGTSSNHEMYKAALCIADAAKSWKFPDPGERPAKAVIEF